MGSLEDVMCFFSKAMTWRPGASGLSARKIMFWDASRVHCRAESMSEMALELATEEEVKGKDLVGEFLRSLCGTRKVAHNWEKKWQNVLIEMNFEISSLL